jgi:hypothetical protein
MWKCGECENVEIRLRNQHNLKCGDIEDMKIVLQVE